jgi:hypothetical protein
MAPITAFHQSGMPMTQPYSPTHSSISQLRISGCNISCDSACCGSIHSNANWSDGVLTVSRSHHSHSHFISYENQLNERRQLRMAGRTILRLIHHLRQRRRQAGGSSSLIHIAAHTLNSDIHSVGNRLADLRANSSRSQPRSSPAGCHSVSANLTSASATIMVDM